MYDATFSTWSEAIAYIKSILEAESTVEIDSSLGDDSVTLQTIHGAKGLNYPIVFCAKINRRTFPQYGRPSSRTTVTVRWISRAVSRWVQRELFK